ncbi:CLUMA_CG018762, isoform A [Clunio marinus]|uniref:CLUMA_CG018762, isoform A n=1 Tax=Clunio marinus TaxID=568069 RepID=A0A1J1IZV0_9DIPT|nr:CLUMA_CG018762, isoform A [Clunio marinus]
MKERRIAMQQRTLLKNFSHRNFYAFNVISSYLQLISRVNFTAIKTFERRRSSVHRVVLKQRPVRRRTPLHQSPTCCVYEAVSTVFTITNTFKEI